MSDTVPDDQVPIPTQKISGGTSNGMPSWADFMKQLEEEEANNPEPMPAAAKRPAAKRTVKATAPAAAPMTDDQLEKKRKREEDAEKRRMEMKAKIAAGRAAVSSAPESEQSSSASSEIAITVLSSDTQAPKETPPSKPAEETPPSIFPAVETPIAIPPPVPVAAVVDETSQPTPEPTPPVETTPIALITVTLPLQGEAPTITIAEPTPTTTHIIPSEPAKSVVSDQVDANILAPVQVIDATPVSVPVVVSNPTSTQSHSTPILDTTMTAHVSSPSLNPEPSTQNSSDSFPLQLLPITEPSEPVAHHHTADPVLPKHSPAPTAIPQEAAKPEAASNLLSANILSMASNQSPLRSHPTSSTTSVSTSYSMSPSANTRLISSNSDDMISPFPRVASSPQVPSMPPSYGFPHPTPYYPSPSFPSTDMYSGPRYGSDDMERLRGDMINQFRGVLSQYEVSMAHLIERQSRKKMESMSEQNELLKKQNLDLETQLRSLKSQHDAHVHHGSNAAKELSVVKARLQMTESKVATLQEQLTLKTQENVKLTQLCDELIASLEAGQQP